MGHIAHPRNSSMHFVKLSWNWSSGSEEDDILVSLISFMYFCNFITISAWKRAGPFPKMLCTKFGWNWPSASGKKKMWEVYDKTTKDNAQNVIRKAHSGELKHQFYTFFTLHKKMKKLRKITLISIHWFKFTFLHV